MPTKPTLCFGIITWDRDQLMVVQSVRSIRRLYPNAPILVLDDANNQCNTGVRKALIGMGATYRLSEWQRCAAKLGRGACFTTAHIASQFAAFTDWGQETGADVFVKIDSDVILMRDDILDYLGDNLMTVGFHETEVHGWLSATRTSAMRKVLNMMLANKVNVVMERNEDVAHYNLVRNVWGIDAIYRPNPYSMMQRGMIRNWYYQRSDTRNVADLDALLKFTAINCGWIDRIPGPESLEEKRMKGVATMCEINDYLDFIGWPQHPEASQ